MSMKKRMTAIMAAMVLVLTLVPASVTKAMGTAYVGTDGVLTAQVSETEGLGILPGCITVKLKIIPRPSQLFHQKLAMM